WTCLFTLFALVSARLLAFGPRPHSYRTPWAVFAPLVIMRALRVRLLVQAEPSSKKWTPYLFADLLTFFRILLQDLGPRSHCEPTIQDRLPPCTSRRAVLVYAGAFDFPAA